MQNGIINNFKDPHGRPVLLVAANVFAVEEFPVADYPEPIIGVGPDGGRLLRITSSGGAAVLVVEPKGQDIGTWLADAKGA